MYTVAASQVVGHLPGGLGVGGHPSVAENVLDATTTAVQPSFKVCACVYVRETERRHRERERELMRANVLVRVYACVRVCIRVLLCIGLCVCVCVCDCDCE